MPGFYNLTLWAGNDAPEAVFRFPFDLGGLVAVLSIRVPAHLGGHDFSSADAGSGLTIEPDVDEDGIPVDPAGERRVVRWRYSVDFTRSLPRYELINYELELRDAETQQTYIYGNLTINGGSNVDQ